MPFVLRATTFLAFVVHAARSLNAEEESSLSGGRWWAHAMNSWSHDGDTTMPKPVVEDNVGSFVTFAVALMQSLRFEEFMMLLATIVPLYFMAAAALKKFTGRNESLSSAEEKELLTHEQQQYLATIVHRHSKEVSTRMKQEMKELKELVLSVNNGQDVRFADLHKDLANTYWQVTKLRLEIGRRAGGPGRPVRFEGSPIKGVPADYVANAEQLESGEAPGGARYW
eukprot:CAMPEP_0119342288 /NCGR_PEP_ID=MMETSP1333-20130426/104404_1 /TAXON_ID=418940 /ORGANISM="Scyphosphaera apsteinii, Strain RCC1455" /LENGTH=225 /DNA_ID=CAMNT_0007354475 /DNA_START=6 /DNA_END=680 /DNA_ORIENTATION=+